MARALRIVNLGMRVARHSWYVLQRPERAWFVD